MEKILLHIYAARVWLATQLTTAIFFIYLAWLAYPETFGVLVSLMMVVSMVLAGVPIFISVRKEAKIERIFHSFLVEPDEEHEQALCSLVEKNQEPYVRKCGWLLREKQDLLNDQILQLSEYETYIEAWVHEIKKPLSLQTLVLDNRSEEMSPLVHQRLTHTRNEIKSDVEKILYFSRLSAVHQDYHLESMDLLEICQEAVENQQSILEEAAFTVTFSGLSQTVVSDRKSLLFILSQLIHNSTNYANRADAQLHFTIENGEQIILTVSDNGPGVPIADLPFIFDKGFTGGKEKATGMGLYLSKRLADDVAVEMRAMSAPSSGLAVSLVFPKVDLET